MHLCSPGSRRRLPFWLLGFFHCGGMSLLLSAQKVELPSGLAYWDQLITLRGGGGYKDNVLLSNRQLERSPFVSTELEASVWRLPTDGLELNFYLEGNDLRYFSAPSVDHEQTLTTHAELKRALGKDWTVGFALQYFYQDQVLDTTDITGVFNTGSVRGHTLTARPSVRRDLAANFWAELETDVSRQLFARPLDSEWQGGAKLSLGRAYGRRAEWLVSLEGSERVFDHRSQFDREGFAVEGTELAFRQYAAALTWRQYWDKARRWRTSTRLGCARNEDNGPGYFDYTRYSVSEQLRYRAKGWEVRAQARLAYYDYAVQIGNILLDPSNRRRTDLEFSLRVEKNLFKSLKGFADLSRGDSNSNQTFFGERGERVSFDYTANTISAGFDWEF
ncbi:MAG: hypothetical protein HYY24_27135 [Verrucomicrobia bacterium]|nr:hypothetical protein [Verrucomicrobiota bacterium]